MPTARAAEADGSIAECDDRLRVPIIICDECQILRPLNGRGTALFEAEKLTGDLLSARPSHPLSRLIAEIHRARSGDEVSRRMITFPSGKRYAEFLAAVLRSR